jgi:Leucine-rich repeat (LRR) protein
MLGIFIAATAPTLGCRETALDLASSRETAELTLAEQAAAVRQRRSDVIRIDRALVRDDDLALLADLKSDLRRINFSRTELTDSGLARLCELENLEQLRLSSSRITDAGLASVGQLKRLRFLHLRDMPISDAGLDYLHGLKNLESLYLDGAKVTDDGLARLIQALPNVHLHIDDHHHPLDPVSKDHEH